MTHSPEVMAMARRIADELAVGEVNYGFADLRHMRRMEAAALAIVQTSELAAHKVSIQAGNYSASFRGIGEDIARKIAAFSHLPPALEKDDG